jgi:hypothetical protein
LESVGKEKKIGESLEKSICWQTTDELEQDENTARTLT